MTASPVPVDLRCSAQARAADVRPTGTAVSAPAFALVELPLPWPAEITEHPALAGVAEAVAPIGARVQGVVPSEAALDEGRYRVALHHRPAGPFRGYVCRERTVPLDALAATCADLAVAASGAAAGAEGDPARVGSGWNRHEGEHGSDADRQHNRHDRHHGDPAGASLERSVRASGSSADEQRRELLICGHGKRDRCCGSLGTALFAALDHRSDVRVSRTSHLGGHRFAATALLLPEGTAWAWLDDDLVDAVLDRSRPVADVLPHYRGSTAMPEPAAQAAEAAVFAEVGWSWLDAAREAHVVERADDRWVVEVASTMGGWTATVVSSGLVRQPRCGYAEPSAKADPQLEVVDLTRR